MHTPRRWGLGFINGEGRWGREINHPSERRIIKAKGSKRKGIKKTPLRRSDAHMIDGERKVLSFLTKGGQVEDLKENSSL